MFCRVILLLSLLSSGSGTSHRAYRIRFGHRGLTQIHHVIPRQFKNHETLRCARFDINSRHNLIFLPTALGQDTLSLHADRPCHENGHTQYNHYVSITLDHTSPEEVPELLSSLKQSMRHLDVPWR